MKRHWIHRPDLELYDALDLTRFTTDCGLQVPVECQPTRSGVQNCHDCTTAVIDKVEAGVIYDGPAASVVF
jgi:hypothetical protein